MGIVQLGHEVDSRKRFCGILRFCLILKRNAALLERRILPLLDSSAFFAARLCALYLFGCG